MSATPVLPPPSILIGISQTNDPGGSYFLFRVPARIVTDAANLNFADFPMLGFNKNWVVVSINMFTSAGAFSQRALTGTRLSNASHWYACRYLLHRRQRC